MTEGLSENTDIIEAAARAIIDRYGVDEDEAYDEAESVISIAAPLLEAAIRTRIAEEIEAEADKIRASRDAWTSAEADPADEYIAGAEVVFRHAIRIVRAFSREVQQ